MSHFSVWVVTKEYDDLDRILAPYKQLGWGEDDDSLIAEGWLKVEWKVEIERDKFITECERIISMYESSANDKEEVPDFDTLNDYRQHFSNGDYDYIIKDYHGGEITERGLEFQENVNDEKWDWWTVDGRFRTVDKNGNEVGYALVSDMDFAALKQRERARNEERLATVVGCLKTANHTFESYQKLQPDEKKAVIQIARNEIEDSDKFLTLMFFDFNGETEQEHLDNCDLVPCWAFIDQDGKWHEKSEMGMFGLHGDEHTQAHEFESAFDAWVAQLDPNDTLFVVDCHI